MIKQSILVIIIACFSLFIFSGCAGMKENTKKHSPEGIATIEKGDQKIKLTYSKPYKKGRLIFGEKADDALVPYGKNWRTGANEATEITFSKAVTIQGNKLAAGKYSLYTIPGKDSWIVAFNSKTDYWGATLGSPFKKGKDVLRAEVPVQKLDKIEEQLLITFTEASKGINLNISWDQVKVSVLME